MNTFQPIEILRAIPKILQAFPMTMLILLSSLLFSLLIGAALCNDVPVPSQSFECYFKRIVSFMRGIPILILIFLIYSGYPSCSNRLVLI